MKTFANVVIESLSVGTPVLVSKGVGLADFVSNNSLGYVFEHNATALTESINKFLQNRPLLKREIIVDLIKSKFKPKEQIKEYVKLYQS